MMEEWKAYRVLDPCFLQIRTAFPGPTSVIPLTKPAKSLSWHCFRKHKPVLNFSYHMDGFLGGGDFKERRKKWEIPLCKFRIWNIEILKMRDEIQDWPFVSFADRKSPS